MGKGKRTAYRALADIQNRSRVEVALIQLTKIAENIIAYPTAQHDYTQLKDILDKLFLNANLVTAPKDVRESFKQIYMTTSAIIDAAIIMEDKKEESILDRKPRC